MKIRFVIYLLLLSGITSLFFACKKVDTRLQYLENLPSVEPNYKTDYSIGDTMQIKGRLFASSGTLRIHIGAADATIIDTRPDSIDNAYTGKIERLDVVRVLIIAQMGIGEHIPVTITTNGQMVTGPPIAIRRYALPSGRTDTTLTVDSLVAWQPANLADYKYGATSLSVVQASSVTGDGRVCFSNPLGAFMLSNNHVQQVLSKWQSLTENGSSFGLRWILGSAISYDGNTLFFSAEVNDPTIDSTKYYSYRICKMDITSGKVETLNKTNLPATPPTGGYSGQYPFEGSADSVNAIAVWLKADVFGNLYFINRYCTSAVKSSYALNLWRRYLITGESNAFALVRVTSVLNICRLQADRKIRSLVKDNNSTSGAPGYSAGSGGDYFLSPDGVHMYFKSTAQYSTSGANPNSAWGLQQYNVQTEDPEQITADGSTPYRFYSFDTAAITTITPAPYVIPGYSFNIGGYMNASTQHVNALVLADGSLLTNAGHSLVSVSTGQHTFFLYAGTERGINSMYAAQSAQTGKARWVDFGDFGSTKAFCGLDSKGAVYYMKGNVTLNTPATQVVFYKLHF